MNQDYLTQTLHFFTMDHLRIYWKNILIVKVRSQTEIPLKHVLAVTLKKAPIMMHFSSKKVVMKLYLQKRMYPTFTIKKNVRMKKLNSEIIDRLSDFF